jgi:hypothetical protein
MFHLVYKRRGSTRIGQEGGAGNRDVNGSSCEAAGNTLVPVGAGNEVTGGF